MKNKPQTRRDLCHLIDRLHSMMWAKSAISLFFNNQFKNDTLFISSIIKNDDKIRPKIHKRYICGQYFSYLFGFLLPLSLLAFFTLFAHLSIAKYRSDGRLDDIIFGTIGNIRNWLYIPCVLILIIYVVRLIDIGGKSESKFMALLRWYKEEIKKRPEWEINKIIKQSHIPWYTKIITHLTGIWVVYTLKE